MTTYNIAFCLYGFHRHSNHLRDLNVFFKHFFKTSFNIYIYYALYDTETEFGNETSNEKKIIDILREYNSNVKDINLEKIPYSELDCLKQIKLTGAIDVKNKIKNIFLHREYSMYCSMKRCFDMINTKIKFDYVCISRLDWGINEIKNIKHVNVDNILNLSTPGIICGHLNGSIDQEWNNLAFDPRFVLGIYEHMQFISNLPNLFLEHVHERRLYIDRVMHVHPFVSYIIINKLQYTVLSQHKLFTLMNHSSKRITENLKINANNEEVKRVKSLYDTIII